MGRIDRRQALLGAGAAALGALAACGSSGQPATAPSASSRPKPSRVPAVKRRTLTTTTEENRKKGDPRWRIDRVGALHEIEGWADRTSVMPGEPVGLHISTTAATYRVTAFRTGWYAGCLGPAGLAIGARCKGRSVRRPDHRADQHGRHRLAGLADDRHNRLGTRLLHLPARRRHRRAALHPARGQIRRRARQGRAASTATRPGRPTTSSAATALYVRAGRRVRRSCPGRDVRPALRWQRGRSG